MRKLARVTTSMMLAAVVLAGCGDDDNKFDDAKSGEPSTTQSDSIEDTDWGKPADGLEITGDGYTYNVPKGWNDLTKAARKVQSLVDTAATDNEATSGFHTNINVGYQSTDAPLDELEETLATQLTELVKEIETLPRVTIDGVESVHLRGPAVAAGRKYFLEQLDAPQDGRIAIITFSFSRDLPAGEREALVSSVMASWKWTS